MFRAAVVMLLSFAALSLLGARAGVSVLSGTMLSEWQVLSGLAYAGAYFASVVLAPPLLMASIAERFFVSRMKT